MLERAKIKTVFCPSPLPVKVDQLMNQAKDPLGMKVPGLDHVPCACGQCYIRQTGHTIEMHCANIKGTCCWDIQSNQHWQRMGGG